MWFSYITVWSLPPDEMPVGRAKPTPLAYWLDTQIWQASAELPQACLSWVFVTIDTRHTVYCCKFHCGEDISWFSNKVEGLFVHCQLNLKFSKEIWLLLYWKFNSGGRSLLIPLTFLFVVERGICAFWESIVYCIDFRRISVEVDLLWNSFLQKLDSLVEISR